MTPNSLAENAALREALMTTQATLLGLKGMAETESRNGSNAWGRAAGLIKEQLDTNRRALQGF